MKFKLSLLVLLSLVAGFALAGPYSDLAKQLEGSNDHDVVAKTDASPLADSDDQLIGMLDRGNEPEQAKKIRAYVKLRAEFETNSSQTASTPIGSIKKSPLYRTQSDDAGKNWLGRAIDRIQITPPKVQSRSINPIAPPGGLDALTYVVLGVLIVAILVCLFLVISRFTVAKSGKKKRAVAILEDDEPERSLDEWLELAAKLEAEGRFREAVRCLYVACLLKLDQYRVIRFDRTETNWEHHRKLMRSPKNPTSVDLTSRTREFDRIWYGNAITTREEVETFRRTYQQLTEVLAQGEKSAA